MKNRLIKILVYAMLLTALIPRIGALAAHDAYSGEIYFHDMDSYTGALSVDRENGYVGNTMQGNTMTFENVDFGENYPAAITVNYGLSSGYNNTKLAVAIDSTDNIIGTVTLPSTGAWDTYKTVSQELDGLGADGVHDVIFICQSSPVGNIKSFTFSWEHDRIVSPVIKITDRFGNAASNVAVARNIGVTAGIDRNTGKDMPAEDFILLSAVYNEKGSMIDLRSVEATAYDGQYTDLVIEQFAKPTGADDVTAFLWDSSYAVEAPAVSVKGYEQADALQEELAVALSGAEVKISGQSESDNVIIMVLPENAEKTWKNAIQLYELPVTNGAYEYTFTMNIALASGKYDVWVKGDKDSFTQTFDFISMSDFYEVLSYLNTETDASLLMDKLEEKADMIGVLKNLFDGVNNDVKNAVKSGIEQAFSDNPLEKSDEYSKWIEAIRKNIIDDMFVSYINGNPSASAVEAMLEQYSVELVIDDVYFGKYFTSESKSDIAKALIKNPPKNTENITEVFRAALIIGSINSAGAWGNVNSVLTAFSGDLQIDMTTYNKFSNSVKAKVCESFFNKSFNSLSEVATYFEKTVSQYKSEGGNNLHPVLETQKGEIIATIMVSKPEFDGEENGIETFKGFSDLDGYEWAKEAVETLAKNGIINGRRETEFAPGESIKREEFVSLIMRVFELPSANASKPGFTDVKSTDWFAADISGAVEHGVIKGIDETTFGTGKNITRQEAVTVIVRAADAAGMLIMPKKQTAAFTDANQIADYAYPAVTELTKAGVINGVSVDKFAPLAYTTRAETAVILMRLILNMQ